MKFLALAAVLIFVIVLLILNLRENDIYPYASAEPSEEVKNIPHPAWLPNVLTHRCPVCGKCEHRVELTVCHISLVLHDEDGWYRLFWAGDDTYYYDDPVYFAAALNNVTARDPGGIWILKGLCLPPEHDHDCGETIQRFSLTYHLSFSNRETEEGDPFPPVAKMFDYPLRDGTRRADAHLVWIREEQEVVRGPCGCGKK